MEKNNSGRHTGAEGTRQHKEARSRLGDGDSSAADLRRGGPCLRPASSICLIRPGDGNSTQLFLTPPRVGVASVNCSSDTPNQSALLPSGVIDVL